MSTTTIITTLNFKYLNNKEVKNQPEKIRWSFDPRL